MLYTVGEMAKKLGVAPSTLRYYDKEGLLPFVERSGGGMRMFREEDYPWLQIIGCLKKAGMKLTDIKSFIEMAMEGDGTIGRRLELIVAQRKEVEAKIGALNKTLTTLRYKEWFYTEALHEGTTERLLAMPIDKIPEDFREAVKDIQNK